MTEPTPTAAPAAPVAAPAVVPAPAPVAAPTAAPEITSIVPADPGVAPAAPVAPAPAKTDPNAPALVAPAEWFLSKDVKGSGEAPAWYKADKYKTLADQAEAYTHLEKRLGAFTGAPKDGKYEFKLPDGIEGEFDTTHPMYTGFVKMATDLQISNEGFNQLMGAFAQYEASLTPDPATNIAAAKTILGEKADARITATAQWVQANLSPELFNEFRAATNASELNGDQIARVVKIVEAAVGKSRVAMPKPGADVPDQNQNTQQAINILMAKKDANGKALYFSDSKLREQVDKLRVELMAGAGPV